MDRDELTLRFRGEYGRLCTLVAHALSGGHAETIVLESARGQGNSRLSPHVAIRKQWARSNLAVYKCKLANVPSASILKAAREARVAVGQEWQIDIPMFSEGS